MPGRRGAGQSRQLASTPKGRTTVTNGVFPNSSCLTALHPKLNKAQTRDESLPLHFEHLGYLWPVNNQDLLPQNL